MKKNFMAIASLLIAAMLLVVSCAPEANVEGKVEDGLVEAVIGLGRSAKDITIANKDNAVAHITYKYSLQPAWSSKDTGAPIYGAVSDNEAEMKPIDGSHNIDAVVSSVSLGKVTPGLWKIHVIGYNGDKKVLEGRASAYFNGTSTNATVFVAPVSDEGNVEVTITLKMQDLEDSTSATYDKIEYAFEKLAGGSSIVSPTSNWVMSATPASNNVNTYSATVTVKSGFNTVTFSLPEYEVKKEDGTTEVSKGGITKTFLAIPGVPVTIEGSVTPAEFVEGKADIKVLSIEGGNVTVAAASGSARVEDEDVTVKPAEGKNPAVIVTVKKLANGGTYTFTYSNSHSDNNDPTFSAAIAGATNLERKYQWYVGSKKMTNATTSSFEFKETAAGDYNVTCVETVSFKIDGQPYELQTSATMPNVIRVLEAPAQNGSTPEAGNGGSTPGAEDGGSAS